MTDVVGDRLLGLDLGTSVVKAALFDASGRELAVVRSATPSTSPAPLWSETDMAQTWTLAAAACRLLLQQSGTEASRVAAVGLTGNMVGAWLVDAAGAPVRAAILWNDGRTQPLIERMQGEDPELMERIYHTSGSVMQQGCTLPLLRWLSEHEPATLARAASVLCCKDWIAYRLTGTLQVDPTEATVMPGDARSRTYSDAMVDLFALSEWRRLFPPVRHSESLAGFLHAEAAAATGLRAGTPVAVGAGDVPASALGLGAVEAGVACTLLGTNILNCLVSAEPLFAPAGVGLLFCLPGNRWLRAMVNVAGTTSLDWFVEQFCAAERAAAPSREALYAGLEQLAHQSAPGANGVLFLPYLSALGITTPFWEPAARAEFFGLTDRHTRGDLLRALYEGIALSIRDGYAVQPVPVHEIRLSGGGARSAFWSQMIADSTGCPVVVPAGAEFGAKGAALLAGVAIGWYKTVEDAVYKTAGVERRFWPDPDRKELYDRLYRVYRQLQYDLRPAWRAAAKAAAQ